MTTKEQERKALARIRKIVAELGEDSYLATAFDGAWEIAEENIDYDFAGSVKWYVSQYHELSDEIRKAAEESEKMNRELSLNLEEAKSDAKMWRESSMQKGEDYSKLCKTCNALQDEANKIQDKNEALELEVMKLKAKLYDLMMK